VRTSIAVGRGRGESGFRGVKRAQRARKWIASINFHSEPHHLGTFDDPQEAARTYDRAALALFGDAAVLNLPRAASLVAATPAELRAERLERSRAGGSSRYRGVSRAKQGWTARLTVRGRSYDLGKHSSDLAAARAYDCAVLALIGPAAPRNFPDDPSLRPMLPDELAAERRATNQTSRFRGVCRKRETWSAGVKKDGRTYRVAGFTTELAAARAYDRLALHYVGPDSQLNFPTRESEPATVEDLRRALFAARMRSRRRDKASPRARIAGCAGWPRISDGKRGFASKDARSTSRSSRAAALPPARTTASRRPISERMLSSTFLAMRA